MISITDYAQQNAFEAKPHSYFEICERHFGKMREKPIAVVLMTPGAILVKKA